VLRDLCGTSAVVSGVNTVGGDYLGMVEANGMAHTSAEFILSTVEGLRANLIEKSSFG